MAHKTYLGIDVGTSGCKSVLFDEKGTMLSRSYKEYPIVFDEPHKAEQDVNYVWNQVKSTITDVIRDTGIHEIAAVSYSVQGDAVFPVDRNYRPIYPAVLGMDYRPQEDCDLYAKAFDPNRLYEITGQPLHPINMMSKIMWLQRCRPDVCKEAEKYLTYSDYLAVTLCGECVIDKTMASRSMGFDLQKDDWSGEVLEQMGICKEKISSVCESGEVIGSMTASLAAELGISNRPLVVAGGHDQPINAIGAGVIRTGRVLDSTGTAEVISSTYDTPLINSRMFDSFYSCYRHAVPNMYFSFALMHTGGILQRWYRDNFGLSELQEAEGVGRDFYEVAHAKLADTPSSVFVLPHFNGSGTPVCDTMSKGAILGLTMSTTRHDILKGILDSICYEIRLNFDAMEAAGIQVDDVRAVGGGAKSNLWMQTRADITKKVIKTIKNKEAGCLGAAILGAVAMGDYPGIEEACENMIQIDRIFEPRENMTALFDEKYQTYLQIYPSIKEISHRM